MDGVVTMQALPLFARVLLVQLFLLSGIVLSLLLLLLLSPTEPHLRARPYALGPWLLIKNG